MLKSGKEVMNEKSKNGNKGGKLKRKTNEHFHGCRN